MAKNNNHLILKLIINNIRLVNKFFRYRYNIDNIITVHKGMLRHLSDRNAVQKHAVTLGHG